MITDYNRKQAIDILSFNICKIELHVHKFHIVPVNLMRTESSLCYLGHAKFSLSVVRAAAEEQRAPLASSLGSLLIFNYLFNHHHNKTYKNGTAIIATCDSNSPKKVSQHFAARKMDKLGLTKKREAEVCEAA